MKVGQRFHINRQFSWFGLLFALLFFHSAKSQVTIHASDSLLCQALGSSINIWVTFPGQGSGTYTYNWNVDPNLAYTISDSSITVFSTTTTSAGAYGIQVSVPGVTTNALTYTIYTVAAPAVGPLVSPLPSICADGPPVNLFTFVGWWSADSTWWEAPNGAIISSVINPATAQSGQYRLWLLRTGCPIPTFRNVPVTINPVVQINAPNPAPVNPGSILQLNTTVTGGTPPFSYQWTPSTYLLSTTAQNPIVNSILYTTVYQVQVTDAAGCTDIDSVIVEVFGSTLSLFIPQSNFYLCNGTPDTIVTIPTGGTGNYSISWSPTTGLSNPNSFNPTFTATANTTYTATFSDGLFTQQYQVQVNVFPITTVNFQNIGNRCANDGGFQITAISPTGGTFSGPGLSPTGFFQPSVAGPGTHTLTYSIIDQFGCSYSVSQNVTVYTPPNVTLANLPTLCANQGNYTLPVGSPPGGVYSGQGVTGTSFNPAATGSGTFNITYTYTNPVNNCSGFIVKPITVLPAPTAQLSLPLSVCQGGGPIALSGGTPTGGSYSGPGIVNDTLFPSTISPGIITVSYTITNVAGCSSTSTAQMWVYPTPVVTVPSVNPICVNDAAITLVNGSPGGGSYSGPGVSGNSFNPAIAGVGTHAVSYNYTSSNGCTGTATTLIEVKAQPVLSIQQPQAVCVNDNAFALNVGIPSGGNYSGPGVSAGNFNPATAGAGVHTLVYSYTAANGCSNSISTNITVNPLPNISFPALTNLCLGAAPLALNQASPTGGSYSGAGVINGQFYADSAGIGTHTIQYTVTNAQGCTNVSTQNITVFANPVLSIAPSPDYCLDQVPVVLQNASPGGGTYTGPGISGNVFYPQTAGVGTHTVSYSYTNPSGCSSSATFTISVLPLPTVSHSTIAPLCANDLPVTLSGGSPAGGTYSGPFVSNGIFNTTLAGPGQHNVTYSYTNSSGCAASTTFQITVNNAVNVTLSSYPPVCVSQFAVVLNNGLPAGGTYFGTGVINGSFSPPTAGVGTHSIGYFILDANGCTDTAFATIQVVALPAVTWSNAPQVCIGTGPVTLSGATPANGNYSGPGVIGNVFYPANAGIGQHTLTYTFVNSLGCTNSIQQVAEVFALPQTHLDIFPAFCELDSPYTPTEGTPAGGAYSGTGWANNTFYPQNAGAGNHQVSYAYQDANGCAAQAFSQITVYPNPPLPLISKVNDYLICNWGFYQYQWYLNGQAIPGANSQQYQTTTPGLYTIELTNSFGCKSYSAPFQVFGVGMDEEEESLRIYPNPAALLVHVEWPAAWGNEWEMSLYNALGQVVWKGMAAQSIDISGLAPGVYSLVAKTEDIRTFRLVIQR